MDSEKEPNSPVKPGSQERNLLGRSIATAIAVSVLLYIGLFIGKKIPQALGVTEIGLIAVSLLAVAILYRPDLFERITHIKIFDLELELTQIKDSQRIQRQELDDVRFVLSLLLQPSEEVHLHNLRAGATNNYVGNEALKRELRKLRTLGLIKNSKPIQDIRDNATFDLRDFVELTERGLQYLTRFKDYKD